MTDTTRAEVYTVKSLAEAWCCSPRHIYDLISDGEIAVFRIGTGKRGIRIPIEEATRWRDENAKRSSGSGTIPLEGEEPMQLPSTAIRALVSAGG